MLVEITYPAAGIWKTATIDTRSHVHRELVNTLNLFTAVFAGVDGRWQRIIEVTPDSARTSTTGHPWGD